MKHPFPRGRPEGGRPSPHRRPPRPAALGPARWSSLAVALALTAAACGKSEPPPPAAEGAAAPASAAAPAADTAPADTTATTPLFRPVSVAEVGFPHSPHRNVPCATCHGTTPPGHASHGEVACSSCHGPAGGMPAGSLAATPVGPAPQVCRSCHHAADQTRSCTTCHANPSAIPPQKVTQAMTVAGHPHPDRTLTFEHAFHASVSCAECHRGGPNLTPDRACTSCHEKHHQPNADCSRCHQPPPATAHTVAVHAGCGGSGCHQDARVVSLPPSRSECLVCHRDRVDHEPGKDCATCHKVGPQGVAKESDR